jgi:DNA repair protein RadA/Sms
VHGFVPLEDVEGTQDERYVLGLLDDVFGNETEPGLARSSVTIFGAGPGFGKSTLSLQLLSAIARVSGRDVLFIGAEESAKQTKARAHRLQIPNMNKIHILPIEHQSSGFELAPNVYAHFDPAAVFIDSIQKYSRGDQDRAVKIAYDCKQVAASRGCPHFIIGQFTKEETPEGSNKLFHEVDTILIGRVADDIKINGVEYKCEDYQEPGRNVREPFRIIGAEIKNRFGALNEGVFMMRGSGLIKFIPPPKAIREKKKRG